jgi:hypothetical protein
MMMLLFEKQAVQTLFSSRATRLEKDCGLCLVLIREGVSVTRPFRVLCDLSSEAKL